MLVRISSRSTRPLLRRGFAASPAPPPPPPPPPRADGGGSSTGLWFVGAVALAGGAYYFQDDLKKAVGQVTGNTKSTPVAATQVIPPQPQLKQVSKAQPTDARPAEPEKKVEHPKSVGELRAQVQSNEEAPPQAAASPDRVVNKDGVQDNKEIEMLEQKLAKRLLGTKPSGQVDWKAVRVRVVELMDDLEWDDGSWGPVFVRLAWHSAGNYDDKTKLGGTDYAAMRFLPESGWAANAGLAFARARLETLKKEFPEATFSDLWSFAGCVAIEEMGGPTLKWRPGRRDGVEPLKDVIPDGLLPDGDGRGKNPAEHIRDIFYRMGFNDREIVVLNGAHVLGRCHEDRSGYSGPWTESPTTFSNAFYKKLLDEKWVLKQTHLGGMWKGPVQYEDVKTGTLMMLPTDMAFIEDAKFRPIVEEFAKDEKKFFEEFAKAWTKLQELGVKKFHGRRRYWLFGPRE